MWLFFSWMTICIVLSALKKILLDPPWSSVVQRDPIYWAFIWPGLHKKGSEHKKICRCRGERKIKPQTTLFCSFYCCNVLSIIQCHVVHVVAGRSSTWSTSWSWRRRWPRGVSRWWGSLSRGASACTCEDTASETWLPSPSRSTSLWETTQSVWCRFEARQFGWRHLVATIRLSCHSLEKKYFFFYQTHYFWFLFIPKCRKFFNFGISLSKTFKLSVNSFCLDSFSVLLSLAVSMRFLAAARQSLWVMMPTWSTSKRNRSSQKMTQSSNIWCATFV